METNTVNTGIRTIIKPTRIFLDCEYNDFGGSLISMALVSENGQEWYEVVPCDSPCDWVAVHVMPILGKPPISVLSMQFSLAHWLARFEAIHIIADWPEDIKYFCEALITGPGTNLDTPPLTMEIMNIPSTSKMPHNALADAWGICEAVLNHVTPI